MKIEGMDKILDGKFDFYSKMKFERSRLSSRLVSYIQILEIEQFFKNEITKDNVLNIYRELVYLLNNKLSIMTENEAYMYFNKVTHAIERSYSELDLNLLLIHANLIKYIHNFIKALKFGHINHVFIEHFVRILANFKLSDFLPESLSKPKNNEDILLLQLFKSTFNDLSNLLKENVRISECEVFVRIRNTFIIISEFLNYPKEEIQSVLDNYTNQLVDINFILDVIKSQNFIYSERYPFKISEKNKQDLLKNYQDLVIAPNNSVFFFLTNPAKNEYFDERNFHKIACNYDFINYDYLFLKCINNDFPAETLQGSRYPIFDGSKRIILSNFKTILNHKLTKDLTFDEREKYSYMLSCLNFL